MNTVPGSEHRGGGYHSKEPGPFEPGLDHLVRALTASGHPHERVGRDAALAAFRAASQQPRRTGLAAGFRAPSMRGAGPRRHTAPPRRRPRVLLSARLAAAAAAGFAALVGLTAAAYAKVLPAPVQKIAYSVLAPLGVPNSESHASNTSSVSSQSALPSAAAAGSGAASAGGACPCPGSASPTASVLGAGHYAITVTVASTQVQADASDLFTGRVSDRGHPAAHIRIRLLEQVPGSSGWRLVASGVTGGHGGSRLRAPRLTTSATFRLAGPAGVSSAPITVTVTPLVRLRLVSGPDKDRLIVAAPGATAGETVSLMELDNGAWETVASKPLGPKLRATFALPADTAAGHYYRADLPESTTASSTASNLVWIPRRTSTGAKLIQPAQSPTPVPTLAGTPTLTPTPQPTSSSSDAPITDPTPTAVPPATPEPTATITIS